METKIDDGGPAFPQVEDVRNVFQNARLGISVRDYFAAAALTGLLAEPRDSDTQAWSSLPEDDTLAERAFQIADAVVARRAAPSQPRSPEGV